MQYNFTPFKIDVLNSKDDPQELIFLVINLTTGMLLVMIVLVIIYFFLRRKKWHTRGVTAAKIHSREHTLKLVSNELHSNINQMAALINISLAEILHQDPCNAQENIVATKALAKKLLSDLNAFGQSLNSAHVLQTGFADALEHELDRLAATRKTQIDFNRAGAEYRIKSEHEVILFRLCQEIFHCLLHTAKVFSIKVFLNYAPRYIEIGIVYNKMAGSTPGRSWIMDIKEHARFINASFHSRMRLGRQTHFCLRIEQPAF